jgi:hypothetical protein
MKTQIETAIKSAARLTYDPTTDTLSADGCAVGGADALTREMMLEMIDESSSGDDDEALFDSLVEIV